MRSQLPDDRSAKNANEFMPIKLLSGVVVTALILFLGPAPGRAGAPQKPHRIIVDFEYNFAIMHACPVKGSAPCVKEFDVFHITETGRQILLFSIPAPAGAKDQAHQISGASKPLVFVPGKYLIGVSAVTDRGAISDPQACTSVVTIEP